MKHQSPATLRKRLSTRTHVMGILNVTPDSFSDGGKYFTKRKALARAFQMIKEGADIIDIGGESTRPGASQISIDEEMSRVIPVIRELSGRTDTAISIDTRKHEVAREAVRSGAIIINDVSGLRFDRKMARIVSGCGSMVILMHMRGTPRQMQDRAVYDDVVHEVIAELNDSLDLALGEGIAKDRIIIDPGIGFAKIADDNIRILARLGEFKMLGYPICVGTSRKSFIGKVLGYKNSDDRLYGSIATGAVAVINGANILRVHDVRATLDATRMIDRILRTRPN